MGPEAAKETPAPANCVRRAGSSGECSSGDGTTTSHESSGVKKATAAESLLSFDEKSGTAEGGRASRVVRSPLERSPASASHGVTRSDGPAGFGQVRSGLLLGRSLGP